MSRPSGVLKQRSNSGRHGEHDLRGWSAGAGTAQLFRGAMAGLDRDGIYVIELSHPDQYSEPIAEHIAQSGAYDIIDIERPGFRRWPMAG
jgi:hypothetical protein